VCRSFDSLLRVASHACVGWLEMLRVAARACDAIAVARNLQGLSCMLSLSLLLSAASVVHAQERILLQEVMPELAGSPLGVIDVAPAPAIGASLVVRKSDVLRALLQAGAVPKGLNIPRSVRITRDVKVMSRDQLTLQTQETLLQAAAPCQVRDVHFPSEVRVASGPAVFRAEFTNGLRNGPVSGAVFVEAGGVSTRVPLMATLQCPPPDISAGTQVTALAVVGHVWASAPAEARQPGRVGEVIRVTNRATGASLRGRVLDARTVEVVP
jgi:hypothetical protein